MEEVLEEPTVGLEDITAKEKRDTSSELQFQKLGKTV